MTPGEAEAGRAELKRAADAVRGARVLLHSGDRAGAASRLYYAVFHAARAALTIRGLHSKTHSGQITLFNETFGPAPVLDRLFALRLAADYEKEPFTVETDVLAARAQEAAEFVDRCRGLIDEALASGPDEPDPPPDV